MAVDKKNEPYEIPIPKWVRIYAFGALVLAMVALTIASFYFRISRATPVSMFKDQKGYFISTPISEFEAISSLDSVEFRETTMGAKAKLVLQLDEYSLNGRNFKIPVNVIIMDPRLQDVRPGVEYHGFLLLENSTLMSKLLKR